jgi:hypothetical protein
MRYLGTLIIAILLSATSAVAGSESLTVPALGSATSKAILVANGDSLYTQLEAVQGAGDIDLDVDVETAARPGGPWKAAHFANIIALATAASPAAAEDAPQALTGELYIRYVVNNTDAAEEVEVTLTWGVGGEPLKPGLDGESRLFKSSVGATADLTVDGTGAATSGVVYAKGYGHVSAYYGAGTGAGGTLTLQRSASRGGPWFTAASSAWSADTETAILHPVDSGAHYYRGVVSGGTADDILALKLHPR